MGSGLSYAAAFRDVNKPMRVVFDTPIAQWRVQMSRIANWCWCWRQSCRVCAFAKVRQVGSRCEQCPLAGRMQQTTERALHKTWGADPTKGLALQKPVWSAAVGCPSSKSFLFVREWFGVCLPSPSHLLLGSKSRTEKSQVNGAARQGDNSVNRECTNPRGTADCKIFCSVCWEGPRCGDAATVLRLGEGCPVRDSRSCGDDVMPGW